MSALCKGFYFDQQVQSCKHQFSVLFYPRSEIELEQAFKFYMLARDWDPRSLPPRNDTWFLHAGYRKQSNGSQFISVDGKFAVNPDAGWQNSWISSSLKNFGGLSFTNFGTAIYCDGFPSEPECEPGRWRKYSLCCFHFRATSGSEGIQWHF